MLAAWRAATRIFASAEFLPRMGSYSGSNSLSRSTPSLLFGRSMMWPFEASTRKSRPRNLWSVRDLVGDSTTTRFLPAAFEPTLSSSWDSSTSASGSGAARRRPRDGAGSAWFAPSRLVRLERDGEAAPARLRRAGEAVASAPAASADAVAGDAGAWPAAASGAGFFGRFLAPGCFAFTDPGSFAASVRDFLVAMRVLRGGGSILGLERHPSRDLARPLDRHGALAGERERLQHALELVRIQRAVGAQVEQVAPGLGRERVPLLGRQHTLHVPARERRDPAAGREQAGDAADADHRGLDLVRRGAVLVERLGQRLERQLVAVQVLLELAREQPQHARRAFRIVQAHERVPTPSSTGMWHFLYFLPLPHGHGSLRPTRGNARTGAGPICEGRPDTALAGSAPAGRPPRGASSGAAPAAPPNDSACACCATIWRGWRGASSITWRAAAGWSCTRNSRWQKSSRTSPIMVENSVNASFLYWIRGSRWP